MQLRVDEFQVPQPIVFNYEELKQELMQKVKHYETMVYTEDQVKLAKADRAALNKLRDTLNDERIRREREYMLPFNEFKKSIAELIRIIDAPVAAIDKQIKEYDELKKQEKKQQICELFQTVGFPDYVSLDMIAEKRWLNASCSLSSIEKTMKEHLYVISGETKTISSLPEHSFEAMEVYKETLSLEKAIAKANELTEMAKRKAAQEELRKRQEAKMASADSKPLPEASEQEKPVEAFQADAARAIAPAKTQETGQEQVVCIDFRVHGTYSQIMALRQFMVDNKIKFGKVE